VPSPISRGLLEGMVWFKRSGERWQLSHVSTPLQSVSRGQHRGGEDISVESVLSIDCCSRSRTPEGSTVRPEKIEIEYTLTVKKKK
jgi:hypothetical protein